MDICIKAETVLDCCSKNPKCVEITIHFDDELLRKKSYHCGVLAVTLDEKLCELQKDVLSQIKKMLWQSDRLCSSLYPEMTKRKLRMRKERSG